MKILAGQINFKVGDLEGNYDKVVSYIESNKNWDIAVFPELGLLGYPPQDLLFKKNLILREESLIDDLAQLYPDKPIIIGSVEALPSKPKNKFDPTAMNDFPYKMYNTAKLLFQGRVQDYQAKFNLPVYDVFNEPRYFSPGEQVRMYFFAGDKGKFDHIYKFRINIETLELEQVDGDLKGNTEELRKKLGGGIFVGVSVCEDIWVTDSVPYIQGAAGAETLINISASPFYLGKGVMRRKMLKNLSKKFKLDLYYINLAGAQDNLVFEGESYYFSCGELKNFCKPFREDVKIFTKKSKKKKSYKPGSQLQYIYEGLITGVRNYFHKNGFKRAFIGLSGGIDSAVTAVIAVEALGASNVTCVLMPGPYSSGHSVKDALQLVKNLKVKHPLIDITSLVEKYQTDLTGHLKYDAGSLTEQNIQARVRGNILMAYANTQGGIVLATGNKSEFAVGYSTLYGDLAGGLAVISDIYKTTIFKLAKWLNRLNDHTVIPGNIIEKHPSAELAPGQLDLDDLPPYDTLDPILKMLIELHFSPSEVIAAGHHPDTVFNIVSRVRRSEFKRKQAPFGIKVTPKAFGFGRLMPITHGFKE